MFNFRVGGLIADAVQTFSYVLLPGLVDFEKRAGEFYLFYIEVMGTSLNQGGEAIGHKVRFGI